MNRNVAVWDRILRAVAGVAMIAGSLLLSWPLAVRVLLLGATGAYMLMTAVAGTCFGYKMMGMTTCPLQAKRERA